MPKFKYIEEILRFIRLEVSLQDNACKNAKLLDYFFSHHLFSLILPKPTISEAIKSLHAEQNLILI